MGIISHVMEFINAIILKPIFFQIILMWPLKESPIQPALFRQYSQKMCFLGCQLVIKIFFFSKTTYDSRTKLMYMLRCTYTKYIKLSIYTFSLNIFEN